jgi:hypothetical protein
LKRIEAVTEQGRDEKSPGSVALTSFILNLIWLGYNILHVMQEKEIFQAGTSLWWLGWFSWHLFVVSIGINSSLLVNSRNTFLFATAGIAVALWPILYGDLYFTILSLARLLAGDGANIDERRISTVISLFLAFIISFCLVYFCLWLQTVRSRIWARRALLTMQGILLLMLSPLLRL